MLSTGVFQKLVPLDGLKATVHRFPISIICSTTLFILSILLSHQFIKEGEEFWARLITLLGLGYFWFGITRIVAESLGWSKVKEMCLAIPVMVFLTGHVFFVTNWALHLCFFGPALLLMIMVAPFLLGGDNLSFWFYNRITWFGVLVSYIAIFLFAGGLSMALVAIQVLFNVTIDGKIYLDIWLFSSLVMGPIYALYWIPSKFHFTEDDCKDPPGLKFIVNWISVPMVFIYLGILYAYFIKIVLQGQLPNGQLSYMIAGFAGAGILTFLLSWPLREEGSPQLKLFHKVFFPALIIPALFHVYAVWERVHTYGITEQRYALILSVLWFLFLSLANTLIKNSQIKVIPATLAVLFVIGAFGPWSAVSVSGYSQLARLEKLLTENKILVNGKVVKSTTEVSFESRKNISSILDYLCYSSKGNILKPLFTIHEKDNGLYFTEKDGCSGRSLAEQMGIEYVSYYVKEQEDINSFNLNNYDRQGDQITRISNYDYALKNQNLYSRTGDGIKKEIALPDSSSKVSIDLDKDSNFVFYQGDQILVQQNLTSFINEKKSSKDKKLFLELENEKIALGLNFTYINGVMKDEKAEISNLSLDVYFRLK